MDLNLQLGTASAGRGRPPFLGLLWVAVLVAAFAWPMVAYAGVEVTTANAAWTAAGVQLFFSLVISVVSFLTRRSVGQADAHRQRLEERLNHTREAYVPRDEFEREQSKSARVTDERFARLNGKIDRGNDRLDRLGLRVETLTDRVKGFDGRLGKLEDQVAAVQSDTQKILHHLTRGHGV